MIAGAYMAALGFAPVVAPLFVVFNPRTALLLL
jgi:hypothetical protein